MSTDALDRFVRAQAEAGCELHSLTVIRSGERLVEAGVAPWGLDQPSLVYSMSKTFTSAAFGIAWAEGRLSPDDLLVDLFPELVDDRVGPKARTIRLRDCLAMASGHVEDMVSLLERWAADPAAIGAFLRWEPEAEVGVRFCYNQLCTYAVSLAVSRAMGRSVHDLIRERVLDKLGAGPTWWIPDLEGNSAGFSGLHITPRDLASFIGLLAAGGVHEGEQLLPRQWIEEYATKRVETEVDESSPIDWRQGYGWQVWRSRVGHRADGAYGQFGLIFPEHELAVVITSATTDMQVTIDQVHEILMPALDELSPPAQPLRVPPAAGGGEPRDWQGLDERGGRVSLSGQAGGWTMTWDDADGGEHVLEVGHGTWEHAELSWKHPTRGDRRSTVAASGSAADDGTVEVRLACVETPHTLVLDLGADGVARATWTTAPLGPETLFGISLPAGWSKG